MQKAGSFETYIWNRKFLGQRHQLLRHLRRIRMRCIDNDFGMMLRKVAPASFHAAPSAEHDNAWAAIGCNVSAVISGSAHDSRITVGGNSIRQRVAITRPRKNPRSVMWKVGSCISISIPSIVAARRINPIAFAARIAIADDHGGQHVELLPK